MGRKAIGLTVALAAVVVLIALISPASAGVNSLGIGSATVAPGEYATVALTADAFADDGTANGDAGDGIGVYTVYVTFDAAHLTYVSCTSLNSGLCDHLSPGLMRFTGASANGLVGSPIELGTVTFIAGPTVGVYPLDVTIVTLADPQGTDILGVIPGDGSITVVQSTPSPTPSPNPTPSPPPSPSSSPTPSPSPTLVPVPRRWGDVNCDGAVTAVDALALLRNVAGLPVFQVAPCPTIGVVYPQPIPGK